MEKFLESHYTVRFSDCDPFGHLNNARYLDYFLNAREDHLKDNYQLSLVDYYKKGKGWVVMQHELFYLRPVPVNERICIATGLLEAGPEMLLVEMLMFDESKTQLKALLHSRFVPINLTNGKKDQHLPEFMEFISDKIIPDLPDPVPTAKQRTELWQQLLRKPQTV